MSERASYGKKKIFNSTGVNNWGRKVRSRDDQIIPANCFRKEERLERKKMKAEDKGNKKN